MELVGKMLAGRYEILEEVGKGGMAYVYKARCHYLNRLVAIKVLKEELSDDKEFVHRFNTEAQAAARISNPHVVSIYDVGFENGLYYIVMEYVDGITLKEYISEKHVLPWKQAAEFAAQICEGLSAAHKQSVIHRDIKPQNIIMTDKEVLKVTDFGIARATTQATTTSATSTIGTVHYLSPEQARGGYTNEKTDIYSLGVVLYEMLTGRLPFDDNTAVAIAIKHIQEKPVLPRILNNDIPQAMEDIVMKALNKEQNLRYASADAFLADLRKVIKNPNIALGASADMADATVKRAPVGDDDIDRYERARRASNEEYNRYAENIDRDVEENRRKYMERQRAVKEQKKKEKRITIAAIAAAIVVLAGLFLVVKGPLADIFGTGDKVEIPNLIDMKLTDAQNQYKQQGFSIVKNGERASDKEAGVILEQDKAAGTKVSGKDVRIFVVVSSGSDSAAADKTIGDYTKLKVDEAKKKIAADGFRVNVIEENSDDVAKDLVIRQEPAANSKAASGSLITLYVSKGKSSEANNSTNSTNNTNNTNNGNTSNQNNTTNQNNTNTNNQANQNTTGTSGNNGSTGSGSSSGTGSGSSSGSGSGTASGSGSGGTSGGSTGGTSG
ncbi:MAG: Stk1 family PASTA domain-containing Ser/Thr kinase, partial [Clostridia bacterium]|nr:Stk1 family PASTA domain-containing Ser/Thr kinase [Clostridia bacterium]